MKALFFVAAVACAADCDVDRVEPGVYSSTDGDDSLWIDLQVVSDRQLDFMILSTQSDKRIAVAFSQVEYGFRKDSCVLSFLLETQKARALVFPDAKRNKASYGLNSVAYEGVVSEKSTKIFLDDAEFTRVKRTSVWERVEKFAKIHKVKLTPEDLRLVNRARYTRTKMVVLKTSDKKVLNKMPVRGDEILTESGWLLVGPKLSESAFGIVFSAEWEQFGDIHTDKNTKVFLKVSLPGKEKDFDRECRIMEIMHGVKGFPWIHGQNLEGTHHFYFTNWVGESLSEMLNSNKGKFPANGLVVVAAQVLQHLQSLHKANLVMLDLSPDNVFIDHKAKVYLTELGLARELKDKSSSVREELKNFLKLMRYIRSAGRQHTDADSVWIQLEDYIATHESPDLKALEKILVKQWGALSD